MPHPAWGRALSRALTTTEANDQAPHWLPVYRTGVEIARQNGFSDGHKQGHREGWEKGVQQGYEAGYAARAAEDSVFAELVADRLYQDGVRAEDRQKFTRWLIESVRVQEARRTHYERFDNSKGSG